MQCSHGNLKEKQCERPHITQDQEILNVTVIEIKC